MHWGPCPEGAPCIFRALYLQSEASPKYGLKQKVIKIGITLWFPFLSASPGCVVRWTPGADASSQELSLCLYQLLLSMLLFSKAGAAFAVHQGGGKVLFKTPLTL